MFFGRMRVQVDDNELAIVVEIALRTAPSYALKNLVSPTGKLDRQSAVEALSNRVLSALRRYDLEREAMPSEMARGTLPLFDALPDLKG